MYIISFFFIFFYFISQSRKTNRKRFNGINGNQEITQSKIHHIRSKPFKIKYDDATETTSHPFSRNVRFVRVFMEGVFDMMHYGHVNAFRMGRSLGTHLIVGINSDESIRKYKRSPIMNDKERLEMVQACKFVDEVIPGCPYIMNDEFLSYIIHRYKIDQVVHGDDSCVVNGKDVYESAKRAGKYHIIPRTDGVSTTDIVARMLDHIDRYHTNDTKLSYNVLNPQSSSMLESYDKSLMSKLISKQSEFLLSSHMFRRFSDEMKPTMQYSKVVYIDGGWDMFHLGHVAILKKIKKRGGYILVGVHSDATVNICKGHNLPLMNLQERVMSILGCRYVDNVLIDAPWYITPEMVAFFKITEVVCGTISDTSTQEERYKYPKEAGLFKIIESPTDFNLKIVISRFLGE